MLVLEWEVRAANTGRLVGQEFDSPLSTPLREISILQKCLQEPQWWEIMGLKENPA